MGEKDYNACLSMWQRPPVDMSTALVPDILELTDGAILEECKKYAEGDRRLKLRLPPQEVSAKGFALNGIKLYFAKDSTVEISLNFKAAKKDDGSGRWMLTSAAYYFDKPVLSAHNFELDLNWLQAIGGFLGLLSEEAVIDIVENSAVVSYDKAKAGAQIKPTAIAADTFTITPGRVELWMMNKKYLKEGWGIFTFANTKDNCLAYNSRQAKGEFIDEGYGGEGECWSKQIGPRFGQAIVKWMFKNEVWNRAYAVYHNSTGDETMDMVLLTNLVMGAGIEDGSCKWDCLADEQKKLGSEHLRWKKQ